MMCLLTALNDNPAFSFDFSLVTPDKHKADHYESTLKLRAKQVIFNRIEEIKQKGEASMAFKLFDEYPAKPIEEPVESWSFKGFDLPDLRGLQGAAASGARTPGARSAY